MTKARGLLGLFAEEEPAAPAAEALAPQEATDRTAAPLAFVNSISGAALPDLNQFDLVYPGQAIDLGRLGEIDLTFLSPCRTEIITGGAVTLLPTGAQTGAQSKLRTEAASCRPSEELPHPALTRSAPPDDGPFLQRDWRESVVNGRPVFKWGSMPRGAVATVTVWELDNPEPVAVWTGDTPYPHAVYPADAYHLIPGHPYLVEINIPDDTRGNQTLQTRFSIDLDLSFSRTALNQMIWLSLDEGAAL